MDAKEFIEELNKAKKLMQEEKYVSALDVLDHLKKVEGANETLLDYSLTHQLYQLESNCKSAYHQQIILSYLNKLSNKNDTILIKKLSQELKDKNNLTLSEAILRREIELLILRNLLKCELKGNLLIFNAL
jgi:hypothetical protein